MSLNESPVSENYKNGPISLHSVTKRHCNGVNNKPVDFIEMLTLDAKEFLTIKCVCKVETGTRQDFCKECFRNYKGSSENITRETCENKSLDADESPLALFNAKNDNFLISETNGSREAKFLDNGLLNAREIVAQERNNGEQKPDYETNDRSDKTNNKNCYAKCAIEPEPINPNHSCTCTMSDDTERNINNDHESLDKGSFEKCDRLGDICSEQQHHTVETGENASGNCGQDSRDQLKSTVETALEHIILKYLQAGSDQNHSDLAAFFRAAAAREKHCKAPNFYDLLQKYSCHSVFDSNHNVDQTGVQSLDSKSVSSDEKQNGKQMRKALAEVTEKDPIKDDGNFQRALPFCAEKGDPALESSAAIDKEASSNYGNISKAQEEHILECNYENICNNSEKSNKVKKCTGGNERLQITGDTDVTCSIYRDTVDTPLIQIPSIFSNVEIETCPSKDLENSESTTCRCANISILGTSSMDLEDVAKGKVSEQNGFNLSLRELGRIQSIDHTGNMQLQKPTCESFGDSKHSLLLDMLKAIRISCERTSSKPADSKLNDYQLMHSESEGNSKYQKSGNIESGSTLHGSLGVKAVDQGQMPFNPSVGAPEALGSSAKTSGVSGNCCNINIAGEKNIMEGNCESQWSNHIKCDAEKIFESRKDRRQTVGDPYDASCKYVERRARGEPSEPNIVDIEKSCSKKMNVRNMETRRRCEAGPLDIEGSNIEKIEHIGKCRATADCKPNMTSNSFTLNSNDYETTLGTSTSTCNMRTVVNSDERNRHTIKSCNESPTDYITASCSHNSKWDYLKVSELDAVTNLYSLVENPLGLSQVEISQKVNKNDNWREQTQTNTAFIQCSEAASGNEPASIKAVSDDANINPQTGLTNISDENPIKNSKNYGVDLDPTNLLEDVANSASLFPTSSGKIPSRSVYRQQSAYRESCASRGSIGSDGRSQEQAPICSREFDVDVVQSDAAGFRVSQTSNPAAVNLLLTEPPSDFCQTCSLEGARFEQAKRIDYQCEAGKQQELAWEFRNGRLVFAESKTDITNSRTRLEQVVCTPAETSVPDNPSVDDTCRSKLNEGVHTLQENSSKVPDGSHLAAIVAVDQQPAGEFHISSSTISARNEAEPLVPQINNCSTDGPILTVNDILSSRHINKRAGDSNSRLKYLEDKLKKAGITDAKSQSDSLNPQLNHDVALLVPDLTSASEPCKEDKVELDKNNNTYNLRCSTQADSSCDCGHFKNISTTHQYVAFNENLEEENSGLKVINYSDFQKAFTHLAEEGIVNKSFESKEIDKGGEDFIPEGSDDFCQFDVNNLVGFSAFDTNSPLGIYDEFIEDSSSDESCGCDEDDHFIVIRRMRGDGIAMVNESLERNKHNPDRDNLKSLLKKPGHPNGKKSNRVVFNEKKNEFFDADYIILIREDCELDDDDDDGVCTCQQHEMVRLTCCEPNCNCQYEGGMEPTPQSPKFAPPMEFVDAVTLSPPEGYKDMELMAVARGQQRGAVCRECSATHEGEIDEGEASQSDSEMDGQIREQEEKEKTDQSQQTTPTTPPSSGNSNNQTYILGSMSVTRPQYQNFKGTAETSERILPQGSPINGILKGGRLWKQQNQLNADSQYSKIADANLVSSDSVTSDEEISNRRSVRFIESEERGKRDSCDGAPESSPDEEIRAQKDRIVNEPVLTSNNKQEVIPGSSPDAPEMTLTFKLGNHVLISNNSLKPNSAVRQLFPCTKSLAAAQGVEEEENSQQYLVTAESLRAFEEAKRAKLPQIIQSGETDETIKKAIERNTLRRSLIRYEPRSKKQPYKSDNSLVERIKQLTCDVEDDKSSKIEHSSSFTGIHDQAEDILDSRTSPPGEESRNSPDVNTLSATKTPDKSFSPSSSSTTSSNSSMSINQHFQQARKSSATSEQILMIDQKRAENLPDIQNNCRREMKPLPDIGGPHNQELNESLRMMPNPPDLGHCTVSNKTSSSSNSSESRRQFLATLAPLTACVTMGLAHNEDYYYHLSNSQPGERISVASSGTEYSLEDIDEGLKTEDEERKRIAPDVLAGTPSASESGDELAMFVQQDAGRIERIKKKYQPAEQAAKNNKADDEDDENDDYGFNRRPSVRGIKPKFSTTTEILQQIQNQLQPPPPPPSARVAWPYYSESGLTDNKQKNINVPSSNYHYINMGEDAKNREYLPQYRPTSLQEESLYQNCANQRCASRAVYERSNANVFSSVIRMGTDYYQPLPLNRPRNGRPQSPPPMDMSKQFHQTMVYIPYNHIEGYQPVQYYHPNAPSDYITRVSSQNQINKRYIEPVYQSRLHHHGDDHHYNPNMLPPVPPKVLNRVSYPNGQPPPHAMLSGSRSESPLAGQFSTARSTQTPGHTMQTCGYYPSNSRYRPVVGPMWQGESNYSGKVNRHSFPNVGPRYPTADNVSLTDSDSQHSGSLPNGYRQSDISLYASKDSIPNSPTKPRFIERGVPEGAASVSPQDLSGVSQSSSSTMTSPTSPQNPPVPTNQKAMFYAMNV